MGVSVVVQWHSSEFLSLIFFPTIFYVFVQLYECQLIEQHLSLRLWASMRPSIGPEMLKKVILFLADVFNLVFIVCVKFLPFYVNEDCLLVGKW